MKAAAWRLFFVCGLLCMAFNEVFLGYGKEKHKNKQKCILKNCFTACKIKVSVLLGVLF